MIAWWWLIPVGLVMLWIGYAARAMLEEARNRTKDWPLT